LYTKKVFNNIAYLVGENSLKLFAGLFLSVMIARHLGAENYGNFSYVISFVSLFTPFYILGLEDITIKELVNDNKKHNKLLGTTITLQFFGAIAGIFIMNIVSLILTPDAYLIRSSIFVLSTATLMRCFQTIEYHFLAIVEIKKVSLTRNFIILITSAIKFLFLILKKDWTFFVYISCFEIFLMGIGYLFVYKISKMSIRDWVVDKKYVRGLLLKGAPLFLAAFFVMAMSKVDQIMISNFLGNAELGRYSITVKLIDLWNFLPLILISSLYPDLISSESSQDFNIKTINLFGSVIYLAIMFAVGVIIVSAPIVNFLYGESYKDSAKYLSLYALLTIPIYFTMAQSKFLLIKGAQKDFLYLMAFAVSLNIILNLLLIPRIGVEGAILASAITYIGSNVFFSLINTNVRDSNEYFLTSLFLFPLVLVKSIWKRKDPK